MMNVIGTPRVAQAITRGVGLVLTAMIPFIAPAQAAAEPSTGPDAVLAAVVARNANLQTFQGRVQIDVRMTTFPYFRHRLDGTVYYKFPGYYAVVFDRLPPYAMGLSKLFADVGDPSDWNRRFVVSYTGRSDFRGHPDATLRLVQRVRGMIDHETVLVDDAAGTIDEIRYDYYNGGVVTMTQSFTGVGGFTMLRSQDVEIAIPHVRAVAHAVYGDYRTNVAVDDAVFLSQPPAAATRGQNQ